MFDDLTPATDLERAFAQASAWEFERLWKEADRSGDRKDWDRFFGLTAFLLYRCGSTGQLRFLNTVSSAMLDCLSFARSQQKQSLFSVCSFVIAELLSQDLSIDSTETTLALRVPIEILRLPEFGPAELAQMTLLLGPIIDVNLQPAAVKTIAQRCEQVARSCPLVNSTEHAFLLMSITKYGAR